MRNLWLNMPACHASIFRILRILLISSLSSNFNMASETSWQGRKTLDNNGKTLDNNDLNQVESAVRAVSRGLSHKNVLEADQNGGLSLGCYDLLLSMIDSVFSLEKVLKNIFKNFYRVSVQEECFCNKISSFYCTNTCLLPGCIPCTSHAEDTPRVSKLYAKQTPRRRHQQPRPQSPS